MTAPYWQSEDRRVSLYLGDCLTILAQMERESIDAVVTDPPYNIGKDFGDGSKADQRPDYPEWLDAVWAECGCVVRDGGLLVYTNRIAHLPLGMQPPKPWTRLHVAVWHKPLSMGGCWYGIAPHWEPIFMAVKGKPWRPFRGPDVFSDVYEYSVQTNQRGHPTEKPLALLKKLVQFACPPGGTVLDPFLGSGTTAEACFVLGYSCIGIDTNEEWLRLARERLRQGVLL